MCVDVHIAVIYTTSLLTLMKAVSSKGLFAPLKAANQYAV